MLYFKPWSMHFRVFCTKCIRFNPEFH